MSDDHKPYLTSEDVQEILRILEGSTFSTLELEMGDLRLRLQRGPVAGTLSGTGATAFPSPEARATEAGKPPAPAARPSVANGERRPVAEPTPGTVEIRAPTLGTFYRAPRPGAAPFVEVGTVVTAQTTVGIIEVMKLMNGVLAGVDGEIREICVENGAPVEYDQVLMRVARP